MDRSDMYDAYDERYIAQAPPPRQSRPFREPREYLPASRQHYDRGDTEYSGHSYRQTGQRSSYEHSRYQNDYNHPPSNYDSHRAYDDRNSFRDYKSTEQRDHRSSYNRDYYNRDARNSYNRGNPYYGSSREPQHRNQFDYDRENSREGAEQFPEQIPNWKQDEPNIGPVQRQASDPFYPKWSHTPKPRSRCSSTSSKDDTIRSRDECIICYGTIKFVALTPCEHSYCHLCCIRLQILCEDNHCPICRTPFEEHPVLLLQLNTPNPVYKDLMRYSNAYAEQKISLVRPLTRRPIDELFDLKCPERDCPFIPPRNNLYPLEKHLKTEHELNYCHVCMYGLKLFLFEMRLYSKDELSKHKEGKGDSRLDPPGHQGHPLCKFCKERFLDDSVLYEHLHQNHFWCYICERNNIHVYYKTPNELRLHFKQDHFLCERGDCKQEIYTSAFSSEIDYKAHISSVHAADLRKNEAKNLRRVDLEFNYVSSHQPNSDQGYRQRKNLRNRRPDEPEAKEKLSDSEETRDTENSLEPDTTEYHFEDDNQQLPNQSSNTLNTNNSINILNDRAQFGSNIRVAEDNKETIPSPDDTATAWPSISKSTNSNTNDRQGDRSHALCYSQSLGVFKQIQQLNQHKSHSKTSQPPGLTPSPYLDATKPASSKTQKHKSQKQPNPTNQPSQPIKPPAPPSQPTKPPAPPSSYSDLLKPESKKIHKQPQTQQPVTEVTNAPRKTKAYEDVFPALSGKATSLSLQPDKQPAPNLQQNKPKKTNKQRKKENKPVPPILPIQPPVNIIPNTNEQKSPPKINKQKISAPDDWPDLLVDDKPKKESSQPVKPVQPIPHTREKQPKHEPIPPKKDLQPLLLPIVPTYSQWQPPRNYQQRKTALKDQTVANFSVNSQMLEYFEKYKNLVDKSLPVYEFLRYFQCAFLENFSTILPEVLVLVPDIGLQHELIEAKEILFPTTPFLSFPSSTSSWSKQTHVELQYCPNCSQVVLPSDFMHHKGTHSTVDEFPALC